MKKHIFILLTLGLLCLSCEQKIIKEEDSALEHEAEKVIHSIKAGDVEFLIIDGCEYIVYKEKEGSNYSYGYMAHKGNCINPIHCYNVIGEN